MKKIFVSCLVFLMCFILIGCGKKTYNPPSNQNNNNINDKTKVVTISESYTKYTELKSSAYQKLSDEMGNSDNFNLSLSMGLLGFSVIDLSLIPLTFCGLDNESAIAGLGFLYQNIDYKNTDKTCKISFNTNDGRVTFDTEFDEKTDSVKTKMYNNDKLVIISEYVKLNNGYASQFYSIEEDETSIYKSVFDENKIIISMDSNISEPQSIFKNKNLATEEWTESQKLWSKYENGKVTSIYEGQEY